MRQSVLLTSENDISLQMNAFIAGNEIVSATHLQIQYHTADKQVYCWQCMHFVWELEEPPSNRTRGVRNIHPTAMG